MCQLCGVSTIVDVMIIDKDSSRIFCPNCLTAGVYNNYINFTNNNRLKDDITEEYGAVAYITQDESYTLERATLQRLILHSLRPYEWKALYDKYVKPFNKFQFMLHDDFYSKDGIALQPADVTYSYED